MTLSDHDLTVLVDRATRGAYEAHAAKMGASLFPTWDDLDPMHKNELREEALPYIFHGTKALDELGYRKPRKIASREELLQLPEEAWIIDADGYGCRRDNAAYEVLEFPATVMWEGQE